MTTEELYFYNRGFNDALAKCIDRKPLTGDEINEIYLRHSNTRWGWQLDFAREIEERHGIK